LVLPCGGLVPETLRVLAKQLETFGFRSNTFGIELDILISGRGRSPQLEYFGQLNQCPTRGTPVKTLRVLTKGRKILTKVNDFIGDRVIMFIMSLEEAI
jgi:hypothetical protein